MTTKGSSTTSEFTKRKNWSQRIVEEMQDVLHVLSPSGVFLFASPSVLDLTGYTPEELVGSEITDFIESDDIDSFIKHFTASIQNNRPLSTYFRFRRKDETSILFEVTGQPYYTSSRTTNDTSMSLRQDTSASHDSVGTSKVCKCFFAMARQYPGKNNAMLDSFLELKIENEVLRKRLAEVYKEIEGEPEDPALTAGTSAMDLGGSAEQRQISGYPSRASAFTQHSQQQQQQQYQQQQQTAYKAMMTDDNSSGSSGNSVYYSQSAPNVQVPLPYQQQGQQQSPLFADPAQMHSRSGTINQDNALLNGAGVIPSTSNTYGALGIGISPASARNTQGSSQSQPQHQMQNQNQSSIQNTSLADTQEGTEADGKKKKPKKQRVDEGEFVCRDCGTVDSPEWRRGPLGPKTLCNAVRNSSL